MISTLIHHYSKWISCISAVMFDWSTVPCDFSSENDLLLEFCVINVCDFGVYSRLSTFRLNTVVVCFIVIRLCIYLILYMIKRDIQNSPTNKTWRPVSLALPYVVKAPRALLNTALRGTDERSVST